MNNRFVVVDLETTGNQPNSRSKIIQIGAVLIENDQIIDRFSTYVRPNTAIPPFISQLTGITEEMVEDAPLFEEVAPKLIGLLDEACFVAHHASFDLGFLQAELQGSGFTPFEGPVLDTVELARILYPAIEGYQLTQLAEHFSIKHDRPHQADSDAEVTALVFLNMLKKLHTIPNPIKIQIGKLSSKFLNSVAPLFIKSNLSVHIEDQNLAAILKAEKESIDMDSTRIDPNSYEQLWGNADLKSLTNKELCDSIFETLCDHEYLLVEAGNGIEKSISYLLSAITYSKIENCKILVSKSTTQLEHQLCEDEIQRLKKVLPFTFNSVILKEKSNYICVDKFLKELYQMDYDNYDTALSKAQILIWLTETETGDIDELNLPSGGLFFWRKINCNDTCSVHKLGCYFQHALQEVERANIVLINHRQLLASLKESNDLLHQFKEIIIDEAHHLEDIACEQFGLEIPFYKFQQILNNIVELIKKGYGKNRLSSLLQDIQREKDDLLRLLGSYIRNQDHSQVNDIGRLVHRVNLEKDKVWSTIIEIAERLRLLIRETEIFLSSINEEFELTRDLNNLNDAMISIFNFNPDEETVWIEMDHNGSDYHMKLSKRPIDVSEQLADQLYARKRSVILTSATLTVNGSFSFFIERLGLEDCQPKTLYLTDRSVIDRTIHLMLPTDIPHIKKVSDRTYLKAIATHIIMIARQIRGKNLILFTSYEDLKLTYQLVKDEIPSEEFIIIGQGIDGISKLKLTKTFKKFDDVLLFGTNTFWEGVDLPEELASLILVRLPFIPIHHPFHAARIDKLKRIGKNAFLDYTLPKAVLQFKQGFSRVLVPNRKNGFVYVFDRRLTSAEYGEDFITAMPSIKLHEDNQQNLIQIQQQLM